MAGYEGNVVGVAIISPCTKIGYWVSTFRAPPIPDPREQAPRLDQLDDVAAHSLWIGGVESLRSLWDDLKVTLVVAEEDIETSC